MTEKRPTVRAGKQQGTACQQRQEAQQVRPAARGRPWRSRRRDGHRKADPCGAAWLMRWWGIPGQGMRPGREAGEEPRAGGAGHVLAGRREGWLSAATAAATRMTSPGNYDHGALRGI
jgi:hypothetical protein